MRMISIPPRDTSPHQDSAVTLHVEYAERGNECGILFIFSLFCEYIHLEYVRIHGIYSVDQAEYVIRILVVAPQEYMNIYSTYRAVTAPTGTPPPAQPRVHPITV